MLSVTNLNALQQATDKIRTQKLNDHLGNKEFARRQIKGWGQRQG